MATYVSKTLIPWKTPIGSATGGGYLYEEDSKATTAPKTPTSVYTPPTLLPTTKTPLGFNIMPSVNKEVAKKQNAPVKDTLWLAKKIKEGDERVKQLREHFDYLKNNNELFLNDKQTDYIKRFKEKYPDYSNAPDAILYWKILLADPKVQEKYGNIGEKSFLKRLGDATLWNIVALSDAAQEWVQAYKDYKPEWAMETGVAITSGIGKFIGDTFVNVGANLLNLGVPTDRRKNGTTSTSELLGKNVWETLKGAGDIVSSGIDWMAGEGWTEETIKRITEKVQNDPEAMKEFEAAMNILNILPGWFAAQTEKALTAKQIIKNIAKDAELTLWKKGVFWTATKEALDAGIKTGITWWVEILVNSTVKAADDWIKKQSEILSRDIPDATARSWFERLKKASAEKIISKQWKIKPNIRRDIRQKTGMSAEEFALSNNLVGKDVEESLARANAFKDVKMSEKADLISEWWTAPKTPAQDAMAASLKKNLEWSLSDIPWANDPELVALLKWVDDFIKSEKTTYQQIDALKSLYDHYNPDNLSWDAQGRLVNPTAHQNAAYRRSEVQKMIEVEGDKRWVDIKQINKDIRGSHDLSKWLAAAEERMANNNIISLGDTQIAIMGSLLGWDIAGVWTLAVKKMLGSESATSFIARKLYNVADDKINPLNLSGGTRPINRVGRFTGDSSTSPNLPSEVATPKSVTPVVSWPGQSLAVSIDNWTIDIKKALEQFDKLNPEEKAKALNGSDKLRTYTEARDISKVISKKMFTPDEKKAKMEELKRIVERSSMEELELLADFDKNIDEAIGKIRAGEDPIEVIKPETPKTAPTTTETIEEVVTPVKDTPEFTETPQVEVKPLEQWTLWGVKWVQPKNQAKFNQWENYEAVRVVMDDKDAQIVRYGALNSKAMKSWAPTASQRSEMDQIAKNLWMTYGEIKTRSEEIKKLAREVRSKDKEVILDLTKKKSSLPLSQKSEVKPLAKEEWYVIYNQKNSMSSKDYYKGKNDAGGVAKDTKVFTDKETAQNRLRDLKDQFPRGQWKIEKTKTQ